MAQGAKTALFTRVLLAFLQPQLVGGIIDVFEDIQDAIATTESPVSEGRTKHIDVRYHFIREVVKHTPEYGDCHQVYRVNEPTCWHSD
jgi:hypothetical protein